MNSTFKASGRSLNAFFFQHRKWLTAQQFRWQSRLKEFFQKNSIPQSKCNFQLLWLPLSLRLLPSKLPPLFPTMFKSEPITGLMVCGFAALLNRSILKMVMHRCLWNQWGLWSLWSIWRTWLPKQRWLDQEGRTQEGRAKDWRTQEGWQSSLWWTWSLWGWW